MKYPKPDKRKLSVSSLLAAVLFVSPLGLWAQNFVTNGDFESWTNGNPDGWSFTLNGEATEVSGADALAGASSALMPVTNPSDTGGRFDRMEQSWASGSGVSGAFQLDFIFAQEDPGAGDRSLNMTLRPGNATPYLSLRATSTEIQIYNGSAWDTVTTLAAADLNSDFSDNSPLNIFRVSLIGNLDTSSYNVTIYDVDDGNTVVASQSNFNAWHTTPGSGAEIGLLAFETVRSDASYRIDSVYLGSVIPEPSTFALMAGVLALSRLMLRRRP